MSTQVEALSPERASLLATPLSPSSISSQHHSLPLATGAYQSSKRYQFEGQIVAFPDDSQWRIGSPLSSLALQQTFSPCEARQVFTATCVDNPLGIYDDMQKAVVKLRFQVRASHETMQHYNCYLAEYKNSLIHHPNFRNETLRIIEDTEYSIHACTQPVVEPNHDTFQEVTALRRFLDVQCQSAPQLLRFAETTVQPGMHEEGVVGGYAVMILMTEVPGSALPHDTFCRMSRTQRDAVRDAFRVALTDVWACGVWPNDKGLRNIVWDEQEGKCSLVDFEDCRIVDDAVEESPDFKDAEFRYWNLDEETVSRHRVANLGLDND